MKAPNIQENIEIVNHSKVNIFWSNNTINEMKAYATK